MVVMPFFLWYTDGGTIPNGAEMGKPWALELSSCMINGRLVEVEAERRWMRIGGLGSDEVDARRMIGRESLSKRPPTTNQY